jgi:hypothetical protein
LYINNNNKNIPIQISVENSQGTGTGHNIITFERRSRHIRKKAKITKRSWKPGKESRACGLEQHIHRSKNKYRLRHIPTTIHDNINCLIVEVSLALTVKAGPGIIRISDNGNNTPSITCRTSYEVFNR